MVIATVLALLLNLSACGLNASEHIEVVDADSESLASEELSHDSEQSTEMSKDGEELPEIEDEEENAQENIEPIWYMDSEGIKSEPFGIVIDKNDREWENFGLEGDFYVPDVSNVRFSCLYYEGDLESYISEHNKMQKDVWENMPYAVREPDEQYPMRTIAFVGNGIALSVELWNYNIDDIMGKGVQLWDDYSVDYLACIEDMTLYCPALGLKFSGNSDYDSVHVISSDQRMTEDGSLEGGVIIIESLRDDTESALNRLDEFIKRQEEMEIYSAIDDGVERKIGKHQFLGKGVSTEYSGGENWYFCSDETVITVQISIEKEENLEDYLSVIKEKK